MAFYEVWHQGLWRNGSASDSRSEGWEFESLWPQFVLTADFLSIGAPEHDELLIIVATLEKSHERHTVPWPKM